METASAALWEPQVHARLASRGMLCGCLQSIRDLLDRWKDDARGLAADTSLLDRTPPRDLCASCTVETSTPSLILPRLIPAVVSTNFAAGASPAWACKQTETAATKQIAGSELLRGPLGSSCAHRRCHRQTSALCCRPPILSVAAASCAARVAPRCSGSTCGVCSSPRKWISSEPAATVSSAATLRPQRVSVQVTHLKLVFTAFAGTHSGRCCSCASRPRRHTGTRPTTSRQKTTGLAMTQPLSLCAVPSWLPSLWRTA